MLGACAYEARRLIDLPARRLRRAGASRLAPFIERDLGLYRCRQPGI